MRSLLELGRATAAGDPLDDDEAEASMRLALLIGLRPTWEPLFLPSLMRLRVAGDAVLIASVAATVVSPGASVSWGILAAPWMPREGPLGMAATEVWAEGMAAAIGGGLLAGKVPGRIVERSSSLVKLGPRVVALVEAGERAVAA